MCKKIKEEGGGGGGEGDNLYSMQMNYCTQK